jgi:hypothetical protein
MLKIISNLLEKEFEMLLLKIMKEITKNFKNVEFYGPVIGNKVEPITIPVYNGKFKFVRIQKNDLVKRRYEEYIKRLEELNLPFFIVFTPFHLLGEAKAIKVFQRKKYLVFKGKNNLLKIHKNKINFELIYSFLINEDKFNISEILNEHFKIEYKNEKFKFNKNLFINNLKNNLETPFTIENIVDLYEEGIIAVLKITNDLSEKDREYLKQYKEVLEKLSGKEFIFKITKGEEII